MQQQQPQRMYAFCEARSDTSTGDSRKVHRAPQRVRSLRAPDGLRSDVNEVSQLSNLLAATEASSDVT